jgi:2-polyprenyl-6-methoxyphenol hydroxylase-like FAD-dependent oxidoreductase
MSKVIVVGAGIGGLSAAHALGRTGCDVLVVEREPTPSVVGAGLVLWPNAVRALDEIELGEAVRGIGAQATQTSVIDSRGRRLSDIDTAAIAERVGAPMLLVERPSLQAVLARGLEVRVGATVTSVNDVGVTLDTGEQLAADAIVGADGISSVVRAHVAPDARVLDTGKMAVRAVAPIEVGAGRACEAWGSGELFGVAGLLDGRSYWFYETTSARLGSEDVLATLRLRVREWPAPFPELVKKTDLAALLVHPIRTVAQLKQWSRGSATLLGDAAHAMEPNLGQGAAQAIEDAIALGRALIAENDITRAFAVYAGARQSRTRRIQRESARMARIALASRLTSARNVAMRLTPTAVRQHTVAQLIAS